MMLTEVVGVGSPQILALDEWGKDQLRYVALGDPRGEHRATAVFDPNSLEVWALEIFDPEGFTWTWTRHASGISLEGRPLDATQALVSLGYLLKASDDTT